MGERILGVDPGLATTGYGCLAAEGRRVTHLASGIVASSAGAPLAARLITLHSRFMQLLTELSPTIVVLEELYAHYNHPMTAVLMGHARGAICLAVAQHQLPLVCYLPTRVKKAVTGHGHATKSQVQGMVTSLLGLAARPEPDDVSDALALALAHAHTRGNSGSELRVQSQKMMMEHKPEANAQLLDVMRALRRRNRSHSELLTLNSPSGARR